MVEAQRRWDLTLAWRREYGTDDILSEAFPEIDLIKECYPVSTRFHLGLSDSTALMTSLLSKDRFDQTKSVTSHSDRFSPYLLTSTQHGVHKRARDGNLVYYEKLGKIDIHKLRDGGVSMARLVRYYIYQVCVSGFMDGPRRIPINKSIRFASTHACTDWISVESSWHTWWCQSRDCEYLPAACLSSLRGYSQLLNSFLSVQVMDVEGVGLKDLRGEALEFMRTTSDLMQVLYII